ncbi:hypothetical protein F4561_005336 [Lipingzhangella halophila]|uniref:Uncharacterized protein n=1 Tax=Lipingzhangella halophila TaxID=1783352 RepID=A0A7W7W583_9ACTN|nr:hypothetical protein [Lipingzhangella halophila]
MSIRPGLGELSHRFWSAACIAPEQIAPGHSGKGPHQKERRVPSINECREDEPPRPRPPARLTHARFRPDRHRGTCPVSPVGTTHSRRGGARGFPVRGGVGNVRPAGPAPLPRRLPISPEASPFHRHAARPLSIHSHSGRPAAAPRPGGDRPLLGYHPVRATGASEVGEVGEVTRITANPWPVLNVTYVTPAVRGPHGAARCPATPRPAGARPELGRAVYPGTGFSRRRTRFALPFIRYSHCSSAMRDAKGEGA